MRSDQLVWVGTDATSHRDWQLENNGEIPLVLAQDGCLYRKRALRLLGKAKIASRIVHTNPDLAGIEAAIIAGLGITVLARSTVPEALSELDPARFQLPTLGAIDISLQYNRRKASDSVDRLAEFIRSSLL